MRLIGLAVALMLILAPLVGEAATHGGEWLLSAIQQV